MVLTRTDENELLTALHAGTLEAPPWRLFLERLRARLDADRCSILLRAEGGEGWQAVGEVRSGRLRLHEAAEAPGDPAFEDLRPGRVYSALELGRDSDADARYMRIVAGDADFALSAVTIGDGFSARDSAILFALAPHLAIALATRVALEQGQRRSAIASMLGARLSLGWLLLDKRGRLLDHDGLATELLHAGNAFRILPDGRVSCHFPDAADLLAAAVEGRDQPTEARGRRSAAWVVVEGAPVQMLLLPVRALPPFPSLGRGHFLGVLRRLDDARALAPDVTAQLFGLSRNEARLATAIASGTSIADAAEAIGLTVETARNYSKRIYVATSTSGQAALASLLLSGVTGLGDG